MSDIFIEQRAHDLAVFYMERYIKMRNVDEPDQLLVVYKKIYDQYLSGLLQD